VTVRGRGSASRPCRAHLVLHPDPGATASSRMLDQPLTGQTHLRARAG
jgi:hypothetical protein